MKRPRRQAARDALEKIQSIQQWENLSENSKLFIECAAKIDQEMEAEVLNKHVTKDDFDMSASEQEEIEDEDHDTDNSFIVKDDNDEEDDDYPRKKIKKQHSQGSKEGCEEGSEEGSEQQ